MGPINCECPIALKAMPHPDAQPADKSLGRAASRAKKNPVLYRDGIDSRGTTLFARHRRASLAGHQHAPSLLTGDDPRLGLHNLREKGFSQRLRRDFRIRSARLLSPDQARSPPTLTYSSPSQPLATKLPHGPLHVNRNGMERSAFVPEATKPAAAS